MCYNCGCGMKNDDMGKGKISKGGGSLTEKDLKEISDRWGMSIDETKENIYQMLRGEMNQKD